MNSLRGKTHAFTKTREKNASGRHMRELQDDVIKYLRENRGRQTFKAIKSALNIDIQRNKSLLQNLKAHDRVAQDQSALIYNPVIPNVDDIDDLRAYIARKKLGTSLSSLSDAYIGVEKDLQTLENENFLFKIANTENKETMFYPFIAHLNLVVDDAVKDLWHAVTMPDNDVEIERELYDAGLLTGEEFESGHQSSKRRKRPAKRVQKQRSGAQKKRRYRLTNVHMVEQYDWLRENSKQ